MLTYNDYIGSRETLSTEFKEFSLFKKCADFTREQFEHYCETNKFEFNNFVDLNLEKYIKEYIPRYGCGFWNAGIEESELYIGVNDFGLVKGIPYQGKLNKSIIKKNALKAVKKYIKPHPFHYSIKVELLNVELPPKPETPVHPEYTNYLLKKKEYMQKYNNYIKTYQAWKDKYKIVNSKLVDIVNTQETRERLKQYIRLHDPTNNVLQLLDSDYKLKYISGHDMKNLKLKNDNPYYWVTTFKDEIIEKYKREKPSFNVEYYHACIPYNLFVSVGDMIPYWVNYNPNMKLYMIRIKIKLKLNNSNNNANNNANNNSNNNANNNAFVYFDVVSQKWIKCERIYNLGQPVCMPINF